MNRVEVTETFDVFLACQGCFFFSESIYCLLRLFIICLRDSRMSIYYVKSWVSSIYEVERLYFVFMFYQHNGLKCRLMANTAKPLSTLFTVTPFCMKLGN